MLIQNFNTEKKIFLIAEIGNNHEGSIKLAKKLIYLAKENGANAVKFQFIEPEKLVNKNISPEKIKFLKKICLNFKNFLVLKKYADKIGIIFLCSVFDYKQNKNFSKLLPAFKIASGDNNNIKNINNLIKYKKPILFSTGMLSNFEIKKILKKINIKKFDLINKLCLMHCVSNYPLEKSDINLNKINFLKKLNVTIGYSDHSLGIQACIVAASLGARIIEKHFTINHNYSQFRDHKLSMNPIELKILSTSLKEINEIIGKNESQIPISEKKNISQNRRGIYANKNLKKGHIVKFNDLTLLRPQGKISVDKIDSILGKKIKKNINKLEELDFSNIYK